MGTILPYFVKAQTDAITMDAIPSGDEADLDLFQLRFVEPAAHSVLEAGYSAGGTGGSCRFQMVRRLIFRSCEFMVQSSCFEKQKVSSPQTTVEIDGRMRWRNFVGNSGPSVWIQGTPSPLTLLVGGNANGVPAFFALLALAISPAGLLRQPVAAPLRFKLDTLVHGCFAQASIGLGLAQPQRVINKPLARSPALPVGAHQ